MEIIRSNIPDISHFEKKFREIIYEHQQNTVNAIFILFYTKFISNIFLNQKKKNQYVKEVKIRFVAMNI